ncbi:TraB/GumN family protein [Paracoccus sp. MC1862]|uniref:TraB/GumN family protein n=1 Tax=Paracoccus sp. MC1862 TaxID=2760307 RepID=UPI0016037D6E|nr:TraB/GumN family protein [Paracoccus sp. MC1862]MBB1498704.1 TraB/GumN family protein [Paracoccus sp. MC1862]QQO45612.1 TraB/GumN family protein [Paracoccus sp. MC1862]
MNLVTRLLAPMVAAAALLLATGPGHALTDPGRASGTDAPLCTGADLMADLPAERQAQIAEAVAATPYAQGIRYRATRGDAVIEIVGTYHFGDPRHDPTVTAMRPLIEDAGALLVEAGPDEERRLTAALADDPSLMVDADGPTLPERMDDAEWRELSAAMAARGLPAIMVSRLRPWYVAMMLGLSPCMIEAAQSGDGGEGLDHRLIEVAEDSGTPILALEPWDTVFGIFRDLTPEEELDMIRAALPAAQLADDYAATTLEAYFRGDIWAIWEYGRLDAYDSGLPREAVDRQLQLAEARLMTERNRSWIEPLTQAADKAAAEGRPVVAAFGALHLPGETGVLRLLERDGWTITGDRE